MIKKSKLFYKGPGREHVREYSTGQLGGSCSRFKVILKYLPTFLKPNLSGYGKLACLDFHNTWYAILHLHLAHNSLNFPNLNCQGKNLQIQTHNCR